MSDHKYVFRTGGMDVVDPNAVHEPAMFGPSDFSPDVLEYCTGCMPEGPICGDCWKPAKDHGRIGCPNDTP